MYKTSSQRDINDSIIYITSNRNKWQNNLKLNIMESLKQIMIDQLGEILGTLKLKLRKQCISLLKCFKNV